MIESILLTAARILTFNQQKPPTNASSFFFERCQRLFLVTSRHVLVDEACGHFPGRIEIELHVNPQSLAESTGFSIPLYRDGRAVWRQGIDRAGGIDVLALASGEGVEARQDPLGHKAARVTMRYSVAEIEDLLPGRWQSNRPAKAPQPFWFRLGEKS